MDALVIFLDNGDLLSVFCGIDAFYLSVGGFHELAAQTLFLKSGFHSGHVVGADVKAFYALRRFFQALLHYLLRYLIDYSFVTVEKFDSLLISLTHDRNRNFVFLCFCGKGFRVSGKNVARCGDAAFRLVGFVQQFAVRDGTFRQSLGNAAADLINAVNGIVVQFFQHFFKKGSEELDKLSSHLDDFLPRLQCSGADFVCHDQYLLF